MLGRLVLHDPSLRTYSSLLRPGGLHHLLNFVVATM
jgi:hypothetical protein